MYDLTSKSLRLLCPSARYDKGPLLLDQSPSLPAIALTGFPRWKAYHIQRVSALSQLPATPGNLWLRDELMSFLMESPQGVAAGALVLRHHSGTEIVCSLQIFNFQAGRQIRQENGERSGLSLRKRISQLTSFKVLTIGQFMVSGQYGWSGIPNDFPATEIAKLLHVAGQTLSDQMGGIAAVLIKDLAVMSSPAADTWNKLGYYQLPVDPSMQLDLRDWQNMDDYLMDINSKYRVRYRRARKQAESIHAREFSTAEVRQYQKTLHRLYSNIKAEAAFDAISLSPDYFYQLKARFPQACRIYGYFLGDQLIGFRTTLDNHQTLHAHYLGFETDLNRQFHLYHNMLFDFLEDAIAGSYDKLDYGRTALEIKSSIGAEPVYYYCSLRGRNALIRWIIRQFTPAVFKATEWIQRRPLK